MKLSRRRSLVSIKFWANVSAAPESPLSLLHILSSRTSCWRVRSSLQTWFHWPKHSCSHSQMFHLTSWIVGLRHLLCAHQHQHPLLHHLLPIIIWPARTVVELIFDPKVVSRAISILVVNLSRQVLCNENKSSLKISMSIFHDSFKLYWIITWHKTKQRYISDTTAVNSNLSCVFFSAKDINYLLGNLHSWSYDGTVDSAWGDSIWDTCSKPAFCAFCLSWHNFCFFCHCFVSSWPCTCLFHIDETSKRTYITHARLQSISWSAPWPRVCVAALLASARKYSEVLVEKHPHAHCPTKARMSEKYALNLNFIINYIILYM